MKYQIIGIEPTEFITNDNKCIQGYHVYYIYENDNVVGFKTSHMYAVESALNDVNPSDLIDKTVKFSFNFRDGKPKSIKTITVIPDAE